VDTLQGHTADGRLTLDEFAARANAAYRALTYADLATLTTDLPGEPAAHRPSRSPVVATLVAAVIVLAVLAGAAAAAAAVGWDHMDAMMASMGTAMGGCR
jgi:ferric-dicitrate binding protein FerR (iron transport regulator)